MEYIGLTPANKRLLTAFVNEEKNDFGGRHDSDLDKTQAAIEKLVAERKPGYLEVCSFGNTGVLLRRIFLSTYRGRDWSWDSILHIDLCTCGTEFAATLDGEPIRAGHEGFTPLRR